MIAIKATINGHEVTLGVVEDDFDVEAWIKVREALLEMFGVTNIHGSHYPTYVIPGNRDNTLRDRINELFSPN